MDVKMSNISFPRAETFWALYEIEEAVRRSFMHYDQLKEKGYIEALSRKDFGTMRFASACETMSFEILRYISEIIRRNDLEIEGKVNPCWDLWSKFYVGDAIFPLDQGKKK
jgi:ferric iron reductase protein FhuF